METKSRIYISLLRDEHITRFMALSDDPVLIDTMGWKPFKPDERERFLRFTEVLTLPDTDGGESIVFSIIDSSGDKPIGYAAIKGISRINKKAEVGIAIMDKDYRGNGYGSEALQQLVEYSRKVLGLERLGLTVFTSNLRAVRAYEKSGFRKTGILKNSWLLPGGKYADMWVMELPLG